MISSLFFNNTTALISMLLQDFSLHATQNMPSHDESPSYSLYIMRNVKKISGALLLGFFFRLDSALNYMTCKTDKCAIVDKSQFPSFCVKTVRNKLVHKPENR